MQLEIRNISKKCTIPIQAQILSLLQLAIFSERNLYGYLFKAKINNVIETESWTLQPIELLRRARCDFHLSFRTDVLCMRFYSDC